MQRIIVTGVVLAASLTGVAFAQSGAPIKLADVAELSGGGATVGTNWKNGIDLAIEELNAKGGVLGRKLEVTHADSQSNPGVARAQVQKALDGEPYVLLGPGYSGSAKVTAQLAADAGAADFAAEVSKIKSAAPDAVFIYVNEEESARLLKELKRQSVTVPLIGETTLIGQKVVELAGDAANGARGHVGLTTDAPVDLVKAFREKFVKKYNYVPDHNGIKGYLAIYMIKATTEKLGKVDGKAFADTLHGLTIKAADEPGILMDVTFDANGDIDRQGFLVEIVEGKQVIKKVLPKLN